MIEENKESKKQQKKVLIISFTGFFVVSCIFMFSSGPNHNTQTEISRKILESKNRIILQDPNQGVRAEDRWLYDANTKLEEYEEFKSKYSRDKDNIEQKLQRIEDDYKDTLDEQSSLIQEQRAEIDSLKYQINSKVNNNQSYNSNINDPFISNNSQNIDKDSNQNIYQPQIQTTIINLESDEKEGRLFSSKEYVPAGAYASAKIISGVDASVGIQAQSDPRPVLIRVNGFANSSIYDKKIQKADIRGCLITGASAADLSSEKVYVKLINMTCAKDEDLLYEVPVKGYIAGQGKSGVRGNVVSRAGDVLSKSFLAGLVGGFGNGLSAKVAPPLNFSNGLTTQGALSTEDVINTGIGEGLSQSGDRLQEYYIQWAEQYQPVVSMPSGINVEVVFLEGFYLGGISSNNFNEEVHEDDQ